MRERGEHDRSVAKLRIVRSNELHLGAADARALTALLVRRGEREAEARVPRHEGTELTSGVSTGAQDSDGNGIHDLMHNHARTVGQWLAFRSGHSVVHCLNLGRRE